MTTLTATVIDALEGIKATEILSLDVREFKTITDYMIIATGNSNRHVNATANRVLEECKAKGFTHLGMEGEQEGEWVLLDLGDVVVHIMLAKTREFYSLERLWTHNNNAFKI